MGMRLGLLVGLTTLVMASGAMAQDQPPEKQEKKERGARNYLGLKGGLYLPSDSEIRDIFGSNIIVVGLSIDDFTRQADKWRLTFDFDFITGKKDNNKFFAAPVTASFGRVFGNRDDDMRPYVRFGAGGAYFDYSITRPSNSQRYSQKKFGFSADAEVGVFIGETVRLSAKYVTLSEVDKFNFSGLQITATVNLVRF